MIRVRAERRTGELLKEAARVGGRAKQGGKGPTVGCGSDHRSTPPRYPTTAFPKINHPIGKNSPKYRRTTSANLTRRNLTKGQQAMLTAMLHPEAY